MIKDAILDHMQKQDVTVNELAQACEISRASLYRRLRGDTDFTAKELKALKAKLELSDTDFVHIILST